MNRLRALGGWALRVAITVAAFLWISRVVDGRALLAAIRRTNPWGFGAACLLYLAAFLACVIRWHILLRPVARVPFRLVFRWALLGAFFNTLLPTTVGGDVVRLHEAARTLGDWPKAGATILLDRLSGFAAMFSIGFLAAVVALPRIRQPIILQGVALLVAVFIITLACCVSRRVFQGLIAPLRWLRWSRAHASLTEFQALLHAYGRHPREVGLALLISWAVQGGSMLIYWVVGGSMGVPVPLWAVFLFVPILMMIAMLPISLNGLGIREGAAIALLGSIGIPKAEALGLSLLCAAIPALSGIWGAWVFLTYKRHGDGANH